MHRSHYCGLSGSRGCIYWAVTSGSRADENLFESNARGNGISCWLRQPADDAAMITEAEE
jgi:hypothetical protein